MKTSLLVKAITKEVSLRKCKECGKPMMINYNGIVCCSNSDCESRKVKHNK